jgi:hypothetical protein
MFSSPFFVLSSSSFIFPLVLASFPSLPLSSSSSLSFSFSFSLPSLFLFFFILRYISLYFFSFILSSSVRSCIQDLKGLINTTDVRRGSAWEFLLADL